MKTLCILTAKSLLSGTARSGVGEVADSVANVMTDRYRVTVVCPDGDSVYIRMADNLTERVDGVRRCRLFGVDYVLIAQPKWLRKAVEVINELRPDILHSFAPAEILPDGCGRRVLTVEGPKMPNIGWLMRWGTVCSVSEAHAKELETAWGIPVNGVTNGLLTPVYAPERGLMIEAAYSAEDQAGKDLCKRRLLRDYGIEGDPCVMLMMCRFVPEKGVDAALEAVHAIRDAGGVTLFVGRGDPALEARVGALMRSDGAVWAARWANPVQGVGLLAGADFLLNPVTYEPCGLTAMKAARFGAVPITTLAGGLGDNMDEEIAVVIRDGLPEAVGRAFELYRDKAALAAKRAAGMGRDFSWKTRRAGYLEVYGDPGELCSLGRGGAEPASEPSRLRGGEDRGFRDDEV